MNLCINARDAMEGRGTLSINASVIEARHLDCSSCKKTLQGLYLDIEVADTGSGIDPALIERISEPFFSTKPTGKGSGMGLATTHGIVHEYGGHLRVVSQPGEGTSLHLLLPPLCVPVARHESGIAPVPLDPLGSLQGQVLVVDDNPAVAEFMKDLLSAWGLSVTTMRDSVRARDRIQREPAAFDLALVDQTMPNLTGIELAAQLLAANPTLPIILYTGHSDVINETNVLGAGAKALLRKPIETGRLRSLLAQYLAAR